MIDATHYHFAEICAIADFLISINLTPDLWSLIGAEALLVPYGRACDEDAPPIESVVRLQNLYVTAFFKLYMEKDRRYAWFLSSRYAELREPGMIVDRKAIRDE